MHSDFEFSGIHLRQPPANRSHVLDQIQSQRTFLEEERHFLQSVSAPPYFVPAMNFKLNSDQIRSVKEQQQQRQFDVPEMPHSSSSLGILQCWQHSPPSKQPFCWVSLPGEASTDSSDKHADMKQNPTHFDELEAVYRRASSFLNPPSNSTPIAAVKQEEEEEEEEKKKKRNKKRKKQQQPRGDSSNAFPMAEFLGKLMKQVMDHQENLHRKFSEMIERLDEERREREERWRDQEIAQFRREAEVRAREKTLARNREALIISYLEKITARYGVVNLSSDETGKKTRKGLEIIDSK